MNADAPVGYLLDPIREGRDIVRVAIDDDEVESPVPDHTGQIFRDRGAACPADHVANEENTQSSAPEIEHFLFR